jgi:methylmalonyl-CoA mutase
LAARWLGAAAKAAPTAPLAFHLDPLSAFAAQGVSPGPMDAHLEHAATTARELLDTYPRASLFLASGAVVHEAGGSPAWELAFAMAAALTYAKAMAGAGMAVEDAFSRIVLGLSIDAEPLASIAKLRAGRILWARVAGVCGAAPRAKIEARSSGRMLTRADRWTNLVRLTSAGFGGAVGGADAIVLGAFTDAIASPDPFALRMARNTQLILMDEAHLGKVADPAAGAWAMDTQTTQLARAAWDAFTTLEAAGGATRALDDGVVARAVETARQSLADALASREIRLIGVTDFVSAEPSPDQVDPSPGPPPSDLARQSGPDSHCSPLKAIRLEEMVA